MLDCNPEVLRDVAIATDFADTLHLKEVAMATTFWLSMSYNFGCVIDSSMIFDSSGGFTESSCPMKT